MGPCQKLQPNRVMLQGNVPLKQFRIPGVGAYVYLHTPGHHLRLCHPTPSHHRVLGQPTPSHHLSKIHHDVTHVRILVAFCFAATDIIFVERTKNRKEMCVIVTLIIWSNGDWRIVMEIGIQIVLQCYWELINNLLVLHATGAKRWWLGVHRYR